MYAMEIMLDCSTLTILKFGAPSLLDAKVFAKNYADKMYPNIENLEVYVYELKDTPQ